MQKIRVGIFGFGKLGKSVVSELKREQNKDIELVAIFSRRAPNESFIKETNKCLEKSNLKTVELVSTEKIEEFRHKIDVLIFCGGSASDYEQNIFKLSKMFNVVDSYDNHGRIPLIFNELNESFKAAERFGIMGMGWSPGIFSLLDNFYRTMLPDCEVLIVFGPGRSQGHTNAVLSIEGVVHACAMTIPYDEVISEFKNGTGKAPSFQQAHLRETYVVADESADKEKIAEQILSMPGYFKGYDNRIRFMSKEKFMEKCSAINYHAGTIIARRAEGPGADILETKIALSSNPQFTAGVLVMAARACFREKEKERTGLSTIMDIEPKGFMQESDDEILKRI